MTDSKQPDAAPGKGHNNPPSDDALIKEAIKEGMAPHSETMQRAKSWLDSGTAPTDEDIDDWRQLFADVKDVEKAFGAVRDGIVKPRHAAWQLAQKTCKTTLDRLDDVKKKIGALISDYQNAKDRELEEQRRRDEEEAAAAEAAAEAAEQEEADKLLGAEEQPAADGEMDFGDAPVDADAARAEADEAKERADQTAAQQKEATKGMRTYRTPEIIGDWQPGEGEAWATITAGSVRQNIYCVIPKLDPTACKEFVDEWVRKNAARLEKEGKAVPGVKINVERRAI